MGVAFSLQLTGNSIEPYSLPYWCAAALPSVAVPPSTAIDSDPAFDALSQADIRQNAINTTRTRNTEFMFTP
jgi:hypothetical protein